jgi:anti-sigma factor RsiW
MTRIIDEQLSALLDGELPAEQESLLLRRLDREPESREKLARYGLIGEFVRDASVQTSALAISERVSAAIAAEVTTSQSTASSSSPPSAGIGFVGAGIAASIALLVMFNLADIGNASRAPGVNASAQSALVAHDNEIEMSLDSMRLTRYSVSHAQYSNSASRQLVNSHVAMAAVAPEIWMSHE